MRATRHANLTRRSLVSAVDARLRQRDPSRVLQIHSSTWRQLTQRLHHASGRDLAERRTRLASIVRAMQAVSPVHTLERGYAIVTRADDGKLVRASTQVTVGDEIDTRLASGQLRSSIKRRD